MNSTPLIALDKVRKVYKQGKFKKQTVFQLDANFTIQKPSIVGMIGPNGAGKTTLLELIAGKNTPTSGKVICLGKNIHKVKYNERKYLVSHHYPFNHFRRFKKFLPNFLLESAVRSDRMIHLYDEFITEDGYSGLQLNYFRKLRQEGHLVFFCIHPTKPFHLEFIRKICEHYIFVHDGALTQMSNFETFLKDNRVSEYLGDLVEGEMN